MTKQIGGLCGERARHAHSCGNAATSSAVVRIAYAKLGPFSSCAAHIMSWLKAAIASSGPAEAGDEPTPERVTRGGDHNGNGPGHLMRHAGGHHVRDHDDLHRQTDDLGGQGSKPFETPLGPARLNDEVLALDPPQSCSAGRSFARTDVGAEGGSAEVSSSTAIRVSCAGDCCASAVSGATRRPRARVMRSLMVRRVMIASYMHGCVGGILRATCQGRKPNFVD
jgi:hypothetical protein